MQQRHKRVISDIPDYLHNSPFLPSITPEVERTNNVYTPEKPFLPNPKQIIRSAIRWRNWIALALLLCYLYTIDWSTKYQGSKCVDQEPTLPAETEGEGLNWQQFAYMQFVTSPEELCSSLMMFETLKKTKSKADRALMYPKHYKSNNESREAMMLLTAEKTWGVETIPVDIGRKGGANFKWADSLIKLHVFKHRQWVRILMIDSDTTLLKHMDELFLLPKQTAIMPKTYWQKPAQLSSHIMLVTPSFEEGFRVQDAMDSVRNGVTEMEIMNKLYSRQKDCVVMPHRKYALQSHEFRKKSHEAYLGKGGEWDAMKVFEEAKLVRFNDAELKKPWDALWQDVYDYAPKCGDRQECAERSIWLTLYSDYWKIAKDICWVQYGGLPTQF